MIFADSAYIGELINNIYNSFGWMLMIIKRKNKPNEHGFLPLPKRWIEERTFGWFERHRRLAKEYKYLTHTSETMIQLAMIKTLLKSINY